MGDENQEQRDPSEAIEEIREKGGDPDADEQQFLESERVKLDPDEDDTGTPVS